MGQESECLSWYDCGSGSCGVAVKVSLGLQSFEGLTGAEGSASEMVHSHGCWLEASFPYIFTGWASPQRCVSVLTTRQLTFPRASDLRESKEESAVSFMTLRRELLSPSQICRVWN